MKNKLTILVLVVFVAIASIQISYAEEEYTSFVSCGTSDNEFEAGVTDPKNVGSVSANINNGDNLIISVYNDYPGYVAYVNFTIKHLGSIETAPTVYLAAIDITNAYSGVEMDVSVTDLLGDPIPINTALAPGDELEGLVTITMLDGADEDSSYSFSVDLSFSE